MILRHRFILYLIVLHLAVGVSAWFALSSQRAWLLAVEAGLVVSLFAGARLARALFRPIELIRTGTLLIEDQDFTTRFRDVGQPEMDALIHVYNRMADALRHERVRLQEQQYLLERIVEASPTGILTLDFDGRIASANPAAGRLLQRPASELAGRRPGELQGTIAEAIERLPLHAAEVVTTHGSRRVRCLRLQFLDRGFLRHFILMEELTEELRRSEKAAYEKLIRMMSHEINNTIGAVQSLLQSSLHYRDQLAPEDREDFQTALRVAGSRMQHLNLFMRNFAEVVRLPPPVRRPCDLVSLLEEVERLFRPELERRRIRWVWAHGTALEPVELDRYQMEQVLVNVLKNAAEAIGEDGTITVRTGRDSGRGFVAVEDTGAGLDENVRSQLFTPFFTTKDYGQGIGLTLVQEILRQHGFDFSLDAVPGEPTRFVIWLQASGSGVRGRPAPRAPES